MKKDSLSFSKLITIVCILLVDVALFIFNAVSGAPNGNKTVYTTYTGECYHLSSCHHLRESKLQTTIAKAVKSGYRPCRNCEPPKAILERTNISHPFWNYLVIIPVFALIEWQVSRLLLSILDLPTSELNVIWYLFPAALSFLFIDLFLL